MNIHETLKVCMKINKYACNHEYALKSMNTHEYAEINKYAEINEYA